MRHWAHQHSATGPASLRWPRLQPDVSKCRQPAHLVAVAARPAATMASAAAALNRLKVTTMAGKSPSCVFLPAGLHRRL